jgi:hypothetical protein
MGAVELQGQSLILTVSVVTSLGFMLIGFDNGLMGGLGKSQFSSLCSWVQFCPINR